MLDEKNVRDRVICALDCDRETALGLVDDLAGHAGWVKVGMTLYYACGPEIVAEMHKRGLKVFLDLKLHDIPHQVRGAAKSASLAGADMLSIHGCGGTAMVAAAREGVEEAAAERDARTRIVAISVLTSMGPADLAEVGVTVPVDEQVLRLSRLAYEAGADGMVCSPLEASRVRTALGDDALIVTPGIRPATAALGDQVRTAGPASAFRAGASHIVVGRPITQAENPLGAYEHIICQIVGD